jgi:hypothetical protein
MNPKNFNMGDNKFFLNSLITAVTKYGVLFSKHMLIHGFMSKSEVGKENKDHKRNNDKQFTFYHSIIFIYSGSTLTESFSKCFCLTHEIDKKVL